MFVTFTFSNIRNVEMKMFYFICCQISPLLVLLIDLCYLYRN
uniref:Uncharacterized protein n=1 Tax=Rhizophora mucronata TaxID=61149 RepID=A0A2P2ITJ9_RHIMU